MSNRGFGRRNWNKRKRSNPAKAAGSIDNAGKSGSGNNAKASTSSGTKEHLMASTNFGQSVASYDLDRKDNNVYYYWKMYFYDEEYTEKSVTVRKVQAVEDFMKRHQELFPTENLKSVIACSIDINMLYNDDIFESKWATFKRDIRENPRHTLNCISLARHQAVINQLPMNNKEKFLEKVVDPSMVRAKVLNYGRLVPLKDLKVNLYGSLISLRGCIMRVGSKKLLADWIVFSCSKCGLTKVMKQPDGLYTLPKQCQICGARKFDPLLDSPSTRTVPLQVIRIQEHLGDEQDDRGRMPRTVDIELIDDLVDTCMAGEDITVTGIIKIRGTDDGGSKGNASNVASLYMEAVSIVSNKDMSQNKYTMGIELKEEDYALIQEIHSETNLFRLLVQSLCPGIFGYEMVKAGLILSLFGGNANRSIMRDDIHILIVGDPGLGKSQMLQACARVAPKGVYICGNASTSSGLTVSLSRESGSSDFVLEPGALVLADKGCCCIDEFDKMTTQHEALLEAMEQQRVSLAKSGTMCSIPARTTVLAAANPTGGRYNKAKTKAENLKISQQLLSRFDLVFILSDQSNEQFDSLLSEHLMALYAGTKIHNEYARSVASSSTVHSQPMDASLGARLSVSTNEDLDTIPHPLVRKYISYAREYVRPMISKAAAEVLQTFYLHLREEQNTSDNIHVCGRQLEAMVRLTEARAKLELREEATERDALDVIEIVRYTMVDVSSDDIICNNLSGSRSGKLTTNKVKAYMQLLRNTASIRGTTIFTTNDLKDIAQKGNLAIDDFYSFIATLNERCFLLNKGSGMYKLLSANDV